MLPLGAMLLAGSMGAMAQEAGTAAQAKTLAPVTVTEQAEGKDSLRATTTSIGKGKQELRNIPQSITVVTEKLINDRNLDTLKEVLHSTAGVTFQAAEGGEEDIRLRGFSLASTGDIFLDGMRDPAFYDRDTFNNDRIELLRGSASMLFGRGSTGGAVNQVSKPALLKDETEITTTVGNHNFRRLTADFNIKTADDAALRINGMYTQATNNGAGSSIDKDGLAANYRFGIGSKDEFSASLYSLDNRNGMNYGIPWIKPKATDSQSANTLINSLDPSAYFGMAGDQNGGNANMGSLAHIHRFGVDTELKTQIRKGRFQRDQRAGTVRFAGTAVQPAVDLGNFSGSTVFTRGTNLKVQDMDTLNFQSDLSSKFDALGVGHEVVAGVDFSREEKTVFTALSVAQGGVNLVKPNTTAGTPGDGAWVDESLRSFREGSNFVAKAYGIYAQDLVQIAPAWKLLGGLRYDSMKGRYSTYAVPTAATTPVTTTAYQQNISNWSKRFGVLYQPNPLHSYHFSYGTSFNTSADTYSYNANSANTDPESSENIELGAKLDSADKRFNTRLAIFRATKLNERNTDPDTAATRLLLSGKRHTAGFEIDVSGRITDAWEMWGSYMWMPVARVDKAASTATTVGNRVGDRPGLSPKHSGSIWNTYQFTPAFRAGVGINFRSAQSPADVTAPAWEAPSYATGDLMAEYTVNDQLSFKANVNNVTNKLYADALYRGHYVPGAGRIVQLAMTARF
ncbi:putative TonB-dependent receptor BfrD [Comamonadaceae bacterium OS-1]|nr:putative TonB-dependent receptor BfrD [Comamonadaceae bacterium OS-1]